MIPNTRPQDIAAIDKSTRPVWEEYHDQKHLLAQELIYLYRCNQWRLHRRILNRRKKLALTRYLIKRKGLVSCPYS